MPEQLATSRNVTDLNLGPDAHAPVPPGTLREISQVVTRHGSATRDTAGQPYHFLALSGGGLYGAFGVGILVGWTESGTRPQFDVVTGISTGGLIATFAFLGPAYDQLMLPYAEGMQRSDILRRRSVVVVPFSDAAFSSDPLRREIEKTITPQILCEVAKAHAAGRRLYIGTTNLDTRRLIIWDMGEIASRGTAEDLALYRAVVLASCSVPAVFPPVRIPVEFDGRRYEELHADGGANDGVIFRSFMVSDLNRRAGRPGAWAPAGSTLYVISNGKLYAEPECIRPRIVPAVESAARSLLYGKSRDEFYRIYVNCMETGVTFRLTAIPQELPLNASASLEVPAEDQKRIVQSGYEIGRVAPHGEGWRDLPPGTDPTEQALPRAGTRFMSGERPPPVRP